MAKPHGNDGTGRLFDWKGGMVGGLFALAFIAGMLALIFSPSDKTALEVVVVALACALILFLLSDRISRIIWSPRGFEAELVRIENTVEDIGDKQITHKDELNFVILNFINKFELMHLEGLERDGPYRFDRVPWTFEQELVHLRSLGFIEHLKDRGIVEMKREGAGDLKSHFKITDAGREYLQLRRKVAGEAKASEPSADA